MLGPSKQCRNGYSTRCARSSAEIAVRGRLLAARISFGFTFLTEPEGTLSSPGFCTIFPRASVGTSWSDCGQLPARERGSSSPTCSHIRHGTLFRGVAMSNLTIISWRYERDLRERTPASDSEAKAHTRGIDLRSLNLSRRIYLEIWGESGCGHLLPNHKKPERISSTLYLVPFVSQGQQCAPVVVFGNK